MFREYLTEAEMERMLTAAKTNLWGIATPRCRSWPRHGLRASGLVDPDP
jgi:hypothetical protein